jgi:hypothetical protein
MVLRKDDYRSLAIWALKAIGGLTVAGFLCYWTANDPDMVDARRGVISGVAGFIFGSIPSTR